MARPIVAVSTLLLFALGAAHAQARKPSTPEDRAKAVEVARSLEADPLGARAKEQRNWVTHWLIDVPDINVKVCANLLEPLLKSNKNYSPEILTQMVPSAAAFIIANPDKAQDDVAVYTAALEGSLRAYEAILKQKPKANWPFLDDLIVKRDSSNLAEYVRQAAVHCK
jgi:hypothetical protein